MIQITTSMEEEKKPKRPRIGSTLGAQPTESTDTENTTRYERVNYNKGEETGYNNSGERISRPYGNNYQQYQHRQQGGYNNDYHQRQGGYHFGNRYNQQTYQNRNYGQQQMDSPEALNDSEKSMPNTDDLQQHRPQYQHRPYGQRQQGGYNNYGGYNPNRYQQYNNRNNQSGYNNRNWQQGPYNNRNSQQRPYNPNRQQGGYNNNYGGYNPNRYQQYNNGYNNRNRQQGPYNNRNNQGIYKPQGKRFTPRPKAIDYVLNDIDPNEPIRLNKFMANAGICSRREADEHIAAGLIKVNGEVVVELGTKISRSDVVEFNDKVVTPERKCYILLNKPKNCVTTSDDPNGRTTVLDIVKNACQERIYPVGRLDRNTTGVLLLTNDGDLASKLTHPKFVKKKIYHVWTDKDISEDDMQRIADGIELEDGEIHADAISYVTDKDRNQAGIEIHSGRNRIVRRIFESLGYRVTKLDRVYFAGLTKKNLSRGRWRYLTQEEVNHLRQGSFE